MFFNDHNPPHFHVEYQDFEATIDIESGVVKGEMPRRALKLIYEWLDLHKSELIENWELAQNQEPLKKIEPLT
ncbi:DUF4160 domain-containing protein [uncultured Imperialibacter sp.]|uniref:DUF4160 domain-containing protein n=1 Tax=uncultured Imperialibacter sp. TaxID=1672639 RepID=UPI0030D897A1